jgi:hypothetical protein
MKGCCQLDLAMISRSDAKVGFSREDLFGAELIRPCEGISSGHPSPAEKNLEGDLKFSVGEI